MLNSFRRQPIPTIKRIPLPVLSHALAWMYRWADHRGMLSDFIADPQMIYEKYWPYRALRRRLFPRAEPLVSVVMATRNNSATIKDAVTSLLRQSHSNIEVIVVDDASEDDTKSIIRRMQMQDHRIIYFRNAHHQGTGQSRNVGMHKAQGEYLTFQDGDDISHPARIEMQLQRLLSDPTKKISVCNYVRVNGHGTRLWLNEKRIMTCGIAMMFPRREALEKVGYFSDMSVSEDYEYLARLKIAFGPSSYSLVFRTLYFALFRPGSSFFGDVKWTQIAPDRIIYDREETQAQRLQKVQEKLNKMRNGELSYYVAYSTGRNFDMAPE